MIKKGTVVRYKRHLYSVDCLKRKGAYVTALIRIGNHRHEEVPLEQLQELGV